MYLALQSYLSLFTEGSDMPPKRKAIMDIRYMCPDTVSGFGIPFFTQPVLGRCWERVCRKRNSSHKALVDAQKYRGGCLLRKPTKPLIIPSVCATFHSPPCSKYPDMHTNVHTHALIKLETIFRHTAAAEW